MAKEMSGIVEQHIADTTAEDDAERHPQNEIVEIDDGQWCRSAPVALIADQRARIEPAQQNADDVSQRIPADGNRPDGHQHRVEVRKRQG